MRIAVANLTAAGTTAEAHAGAARLAATAAAEGAGLLLLPRHLVGGEDAAQAGEPSDGPGARAMGALARETGLAIAYGYVERCSGALFDSVLLADRTGCHLANYRRAHTAAGEDGFARGHWLSTMPVAGRRVGLLVGYDLLFPEAARVLRLAGCDLILVAGGFGPGGEAVAALLSARALENGCPVAFASADPALAPAAVVGPDGARVGRAVGDAGDGLVLADLPEAAGAGLADGTLPDRRPRLYARLALVEAGAESRG